jgi:hypothetical protein
MSQQPVDQFTIVQWMIMIAVVILCVWILAQTAQELLTLEHPPFTIDVR